MTQTVLLGDVAEKIAMGPFGSNIKVSTFVESGIPIVSGQHLKGVAVDDNEGYNFISTEHADKLRNSNVFRGDVVFTHAGNIGQVAYIPKNSKYDRYVLSQRQFYLRPSPELMAEYLTYYFKSPKGQSQLLEFANQTGVPSLSQPATNLKKIKIDLPDLETQKKIADILGTIDEKNELNRQMNETLEQMGQALFRHYFIDNPEVKIGSVAKVSDFAEHLKISVQPMKSPDSVFHQYSIPGYDNSYSPEVSRGETIKSGKYEVAPNSILVSKLNPATPRVWAVIEPKDNAVCSTELQVIKPRDYYAFCYFLLTSREFTEKMTMSAGGTSNSHRRVKPSDILDFAFARPRKETLSKFEAKAYPMIEQIDANRDEIQTLTTIRDTLLPRLISGKVKV